MIPVFPENRIKSWPKHSSAKRWPYLPIATALAMHHPSDAHFAAYSAPETPHRLCLEAIPTIATGLTMVLAVFDIDAPDHGGALGASDDWWLEELTKVRKLLEVHPDAFVYRTRGGYRIVYSLAGEVLRDRADVEGWKVRYCTWIAYLRRAFDIRGDYACKEAVRLFRFPFVMRDGKAERRETIGDAGALGRWTCSPTAEDEAEGRRFAKVKPPRKPSSSAEDRPAPSIVGGEGVLFHAMKARGWVGRDLGGKHAIICPWAHEHTSGSEFDSSTVLFAPSPGEAFGYPHCSHSHCALRTLADWVALFSRDELEAARAAAGVPPWQPPARPHETSLPLHESDIIIRLGTDEHRVNDEAKDALAKLPNIYQRGGKLVAPYAVDSRLIISEIALPLVRHHLTRAASFVRVQRDSETGELVENPVHVPDWCVRAIHARAEYAGIAPLRGIVDAPVLRADGSILQGGEGYDERSAYLFIPTCAFPPIADAPSRDDAIAAAKELLAVVSDFPFEGAEHRAAWLAALLTLFARPAFVGPAPLIAIDANVRGSGKGKLTDALALITTGRPASKMPQPRDDDEQRKQITAVLLEGERLAVIDNISRPISDGSLDAVLTADEYKDRLLGRTEMTTLPNLTMWLVTGNNLEFGADTARRSLHIRLQSPHENPENRNDFAQRDLLAWIRNHRPRLVAAALTILRSYFAAGRPTMGVRSWGSFEEWSSIVANAVVWAGLPDPQQTRTELESTSDTRKSALVGLIDGWAKLTKGTEGMTAKDAVGYLYPAERLRGLASFDDGYNALREAIEQLVPTPYGKAPSPSKVGYQLRSFRGRVVRGRCIDGVEDRNGVTRWRIVEAKSAGDAGDRGDISPISTCESVTKEDAYTRPTPRGENIPSSPASPAEGSKAEAYDRRDPDRDPPSGWTRGGASFAGGSPAERAS